MTDPGFPVGGPYLVGGRQLLTWLPFVKFVCRNERIGPPMGQACAGCVPGSATGQFINSYYHSVPSVVIGLYLLLQNQLDASHSVLCGAVLVP